ncbi:hypothetical protein VNO77_02647 [Canavalia gladiata]|uniref:Uncharacterized protein n=1 Tax=Canavalia gladiata TaxID=3824 RepID=A0AAN9MYX9_CANGL
MGDVWRRLVASLRLSLNLEFHMDWFRVVLIATVDKSSSMIEEFVFEMSQDRVALGALNMNDSFPLMDCSRLNNHRELDTIVSNPSRIPYIPLCKYSYCRTGAIYRISSADESGKSSGTFPAEESTIEARYNPLQRCRYRRGDSLYAIVIGNVQQILFKGVPRSRIRTFPPTSTRITADILKQNKVDAPGIKFDPKAGTVLALLHLELTASMISCLMDEPCKSAHLAALKMAKGSGYILSYDPNLRLALWPSDEAVQN